MKLAKSRWFDYNLEIRNMTFFFQHGTSLSELVIGRTQDGFQYRVNIYDSFGFFFLLGSSQCENEIA